MDCLLLYFQESEAPAIRLANELGLSSAQIQVHHFPDGESLITLPENLSSRLIIYQSLNRPNQKLVELLLAARGARSRGVKQMVFVVPYLAYMRQDKVFRPGQVVSQKVMGLFLSELFESLVTVDAHLHRVKSLGEVFPGCAASNLTTAELTAQFILANYGSKPFLLGPDEESQQWVKKIADRTGCDYGVCKKVRYGDLDVKIELPKLDLRGRNVILIDDMVSTGHTLATAASSLLEKGVASIDCIITHALFTRGALSLLRRSGIRRIVSSDTVVHSTNRIYIAPLLAKALADLL